MARIIALILLLIPGVFAGYGIKLMRDMLFGKATVPISISLASIYFRSDFFHSWIRLCCWVCSAPGQEAKYCSRPF